MLSATAHFTFLCLLKCDIFENYQISHITVSEHVFCFVFKSANDNFPFQYKKNLRFGHLNALKSNKSRTSDDVAPLKIDFGHALTCVPRAMPARDSLAVTGHAPSLVEKDGDGGKWPTAQG